MSPRWLYYSVVIILMVFFIAIILSSCGQNTPEQKDRFRECVEAGGSYETDNRGDEWSCDLPDTVTVEPSPFE